MEFNTENIKLESERLILRSFNEDDLNDLFEYAKVEGVGEMAGWPHHKSLDDSKTILDIFIHNKNDFAIVLKDKNKVIGSVCLKQSDRLKDDMFLKNKKWLEVGFVLSKDYWRQGIMTEAMTLLINYLIKENKIEYLVACHFIDNLKSKKLQQKLGFKYHKNIIKNFTIMDKDSVVNILKLSEFKEIKK